MRERERGREREKESERKREGESERKRVRERRGKSLIRRKTGTTHTCSVRTRLLRPNGYHSPLTVATPAEISKCSITSKEDITLRSSHPGAKGRIIDNDVDEKNHMQLYTNIHDSYMKC